MDSTYWVLSLPQYIQSADSSMAEARDAMTDEERAALVIATVITPHRFRSKRQFWSYCGMSIVTRSSADWVQTADGAWIKI